MQFNDDSAHAAAMAEIVAMMPTDGEWDRLAALCPPPQPWHDKEWEEEAIEFGWTPQRAKIRRLVREWSESTTADY